ncbi:PREDICTED: coiled-coil domain-containing protein 130 homolog [Acropora digitifera]|uniref:coiled-coil domain-containing protein 130 homolog n=1 Tax=Acropora digitifera TaxID=70779 RepID=UPI00077A290E|nr:PREDICTED: coiled-coil domain-containing protein 130 homolog [Acropora digitifera]
MDFPSSAASICGSLDRYHGQHPLRERARKLNQGILIIRFEMPYNIWCGGCGNHIGMGVRYNAEKKRVGNYYTTPIYRFRMKCHLCDNHFEIETDPKNCDYVIVSGARRKEERWDPSATETVELTDREDAKKMATDPMYKLEHGVKDQQKSKAVQPTLDQLQEVQSVWKDDYAANQLLRKKFRVQKHELKAQEMIDNELKERGALDITLVPERLEDVERAKNIRYIGEGFDEHRRKRRFEVNSRPMFDLKEKSGERRGKIQQLLGKRKKIQMSSFASPSKSIEDSLKLGIKLRRNRSVNSSGSNRYSNKDLASEDPTNEDPVDCERTFSGIGDTPADPVLTNVDNSGTDGGFPDTSHPVPGAFFPRPMKSKECNTTEPPIRVGNEMTSVPLTHRELDDSTPSLMNTNGFSITKSDVLMVKNSRLDSLVSCDYSDSSDGSGDF